MGAVSRLRRGLVLAALLLLAPVGCGGERGGETAADATATTTAPAVAPPPPLRAPPCAAGAANCARASGQIAYVERVDPDGDGDAHFVLVSDESITAPGVSVIDVRAGLRPTPLPGPGDMLAAAGPVYEGSFGQRQIEAVAVRFIRRHSAGSTGPPGKLTSRWTTARSSAARRRRDASSTASARSATASSPSR